MWELSVNNLPLILVNSCDAELRQNVPGVFREDDILYVIFPVCLKQLRGLGTSVFLFLQVYF